MANEYAPVAVGVQPRGSGTQSSGSFFAQSLSLAWTWGAQPASALITYIPSAGASFLPIQALASVTIGPVGGHTFYGICKSDLATEADRGRTRVLEFVDNREFLQWDHAFCAFNKVEVRLVNGLLKRHYWHILPANYQAGIKTYSDSPLSAAQILNYLFAAPTTESPWVRVYHPLQANPVYDIDALNGESLASVVQRISEKQGLLFMLMGGPYRLVWTQKGIGDVPDFPPNSNQRRLGVSVSGNPTRVRVVGDRNLYQVMDIPMVPDWNTNWEEFVDLGDFYDHVYQNLTDPRSGIVYNQTPNDPEHLIGRQLASIRSHQITVAEYAALRPDKNFKDLRKIGGRSRMDMPVELYLRLLLFRAYKLPDNFSILNAYGQVVPKNSLRLMGALLAEVKHDPITGAMALNSLTEAQGNGYAIARGYVIGSDLYKVFTPERFNVEEWRKVMDIWSTVSFQIDGSGEGDQLIIFEEPVIRSDNAFKTVDGKAVPNAGAKFASPPVRACLVFEAEKFVYTLGSGTRDGVENVSGLYGEFVKSHLAAGLPTELVYADGLSALQKAQVIASYHLQKPFAYFEGGYTNVGSNATQLTSVIDRVQIRLDPGGFFDDVDFTNERRSNAFEPSREFDRKIQLNRLFPGQEEIRETARLEKLILDAAKKYPEISRILLKAFNDTFGNGGKLDPVVVKDGSGTLPVGTPLWKDPEKTEAVMPSATTNAHTEFAGVTVRDSERASAPFQLQREGYLYARVKGPVEFGEQVGRKNGQNYLVALTQSDGDAAVGTAEREIAGEDVKLILVRTGGSGGGSSRPVWI